MSTELSADRVSQELTECNLLSRVRVPPRARIDTAEALPESRRLWTVGIKSIEVSVEELLVDGASLTPCPGRHMHAVSDAKDLVGDHW